MSHEGSFLLISVGFIEKTPSLTLLRDDNCFSINPLENVSTLTFATDTRFCTGWRDITTGTRTPCPESATIDLKYEQCSPCQKRTGFNPAFYHATSVSPQQEARNAEPHILYLAYFGGDSVKVGISHAARGHARLLEQGARHAIILDTFPTAQIARQYEASIALLPGVNETVSAKQKIGLLSAPYDQSILQKTKERAEEHLRVLFTGSEILAFDQIFFPTGVPKLDQVIDVTSHSMISGHTVGMLGSLLFCEQQGTCIVLPVKRFIGNIVTISSRETPMDLPAQQISLF